MSANPELPEHLRPLAPGYSPKQISIDAEMVALGRPAPPVVAILRDFKGLAGFPAKHAAWRARVDAWEQANPDAAIRWHELKLEAEAEQDRIDSEKYTDDAWRFELMARVGFPPSTVELCRAELRDTKMFTAARDWCANGIAWSVVLTGGPGCGKTVAATWAAHQLLSRSFRPLFVSCPRVAESNLYDVAGEVGRFRARNAPVLVLDDMGEGKREAKSEPWNAWLDEVLTERHAKNRRTVITTNRTPAELEKWLGARLWDRLREGVVFSTTEASLRNSDTKGRAT